VRYTEFRDHSRIADARENMKIWWNSGKNGQPSGSKGRFRWPSYFADAAAADDNRFKSS
jgi:hypothetical protein